MLDQHVAERTADLTLANQELQKSPTCYQNRKTNSASYMTAHRSHFRMTLDGKIVEANPAVLQILGYYSLAALNERGLARMYQQSDELKSALERARLEPISDLEIICSTRAARLYCSRYARIW